MVDRLDDSIDRAGDAVAVVGVDHLERLAAELSA